jgi:poly(3-hydroxybutyrate) depolymerase
MKSRSLARGLFFACCLLGVDACAGKSVPPVSSNSVHVVTASASSSPKSSSPSSPASSSANSAKHAAPPLVPDVPHYTTLEGATTRPLGPHTVRFDGEREAFVSAPTKTKRRRRVIASLHGLCQPIVASCSPWAHGASERGFLVCPSGNSSCGSSIAEAPTWNETDEEVEADIEKAIDVMEASYSGEVSREDGVLTGFSRGGYIAARLVSMFPKRWPYLIICEANAQMTAERLRAAGVRAVAIVAGEESIEYPGEKATAEQLEKDGMRVRLYTMKGVGHAYSKDYDDLMAQAVDFVTSP